MVVVGVVVVVVGDVVVVVLVVSLTARALPSATIIELFAGGMMPDGAMFSAPPAALHVGLAHKASRSPWMNLASATNVLLFLDLMTHCMSGLGRTSQWTQSAMAAHSMAQSWGSHSVPPGDRLFGKMCSAFPLCRPAVA